METQVAVADVAARQVRRFSQSLDSPIFVARPGINHSEISDQRCAFNHVFANRRQLDRAFAFPNRVLLIPEYGVHHTKRAKCSRKIRLVVYRLSKFVSRAVERRSSCRFIAAELGKLTLAPAAREWDIVVKASTLGHVE